MKTKLKSITAGLLTSLALLTMPAMGVKQNEYPIATDLVNAVVTGFNGSGTRQFPIALFNVPSAEQAKLGLQGASIAAASTVNLATATGEAVTITGSGGPITSFGAATVGTRRTLTFASTPTITHNATSLILPGAANLIATVGDVMQVVSVGSGWWRCTSYMRSNGAALIAGNPSIGADVASATATDVSAVTGHTVAITGTTTITSFVMSTAQQLRVRFTGILTLTNSANLVLPTGANITTAAGDYAELVNLGSGVVHCSYYTRKDGWTIYGPSMRTKPAASIASAATVDLSTASSDIVNITGTTNVSAITMTDGQLAVVRFSGVLNVISGASLILPTAANITTAAGDVAIFLGEASSVTRCVSFTRASGRALLSTRVDIYDGSALSDNVTSTPTWTKVGSPMFLDVDIQAGGGSGGSGRLGASSTVRTGGSGGAGGARVRLFMPATAFSSASVFYGGAKTGGAGVSATSTNGNNGTQGANASFLGFIATGGAAGVGGSTATVTGGAALADSCLFGIVSAPNCAGGDGGSGSATSGGSTTLMLPTGGGGGGGISSVNAQGFGSTGGAITGPIFPVAGTAANGNGTTIADIGMGGGGGDGGTNAGAAAVSGGNGGYPGGGGGGGGGGLNGTTSGAGGKGGASRVTIRSIY